MRIDYDKVQTAVKDLGTVTDNDAFLEGFLSAFSFPSATYSRLKATAKSAVNEGIRIQGNGGVFFLESTASSLNSEFNVFKKNTDLSKIKDAFIVIVNENDILAYERDSGEVLETSKRDLHRYIEFFFSLLGIKPDSASDEMKSLDRKAVEKFAELYNELALQNHNHGNDISELLSRLLFCCFADSIGVLTNSGLRPLLSNYTEAIGSDTSAFFCNLFEAMKSESRDDLPGYFSDVKYIDSRLFGDFLPLLDVSRKARKLILDLMALDWSDISTDILGSLVQSIVREEVGSSSGNYTSTANIQKVIGPLFMDGLYHNFDQVKGSREGCRELLHRIKRISVFDPSSGTGNFLLVAYKDLNKLAGMISDTLQNLEYAALGISDGTLHVAETSMNDDGLFVTWKNFYGIESDPFFCAIARLGFLFVVCQEARLGADIDRIFSNTVEILFSHNIVEGNATIIDWETVCQGNGDTYLIGNPSYIGARKQTQSQKTDLARVFSDYNRISNLDYAACWFMLATKYIRAHGGGFAFVTTNSLTQGEQVQLLWPKLFEQGVHIRFAFTSFKWRNDARNRTAVTVVIIGVVPNTNTQRPELFSPTTVFEPRSISPYLVPGEAIVGSRETPLGNLPEMMKGNMPYDGGNLLLDHNEMVAIVSSDPYAKKFVRKIVGAKEFIRDLERWCIWIQDSDRDEAMAILEIAKRVEKVRVSRLANKDAAVRRLAERPHQFREMRETRKQSLVVPAVSSENYLYIPIGFVGKNTIVTNLVSIIYDCEPWVFGVVSSQMHNVWAKTVCGKHEERPRYSLELGYNTFPFPIVTQEQKANIRNCVFNVIRVREQFAPKTLAQLYKGGQMPCELMEAHSLLDKVVESCYRPAPFVSDQDRLESLFELYNKLGG
jgi:hypothetical protein